MLLIASHSTSTLCIYWRWKPLHLVDYKLSAILLWENDDVAIVLFYSVIYNSVVNPHSLGSTIYFFSGQPWHQKLIIQYTVDRPTKHSLPLTKLAIRSSANQPHSHDNTVNIVQVVKVVKTPKKRSFWLSAVS